jgi:hypothetical protein
MGSEASKPLEPPAEWEARDHHKFQIISPMSDLSNPSDFRKVHHFSNSQALQRRASRTVSTTLPKERKEIPAPSAFYFPTKESEKYAERVSNSNDNKENAKPNRLQKTKQIFAACFEDRDQHPERQQTNHVREVEMPKQAPARKQPPSNLRQADSKPQPKKVERGRDPKPRNISDFDGGNEQKNTMGDVFSDDKMGRKSSTSDTRNQRGDKHQKSTVKRASDPGAKSKRSTQTVKHGEAEKNVELIEKAFVMPHPSKISVRKIIVEEPVKKDREPTPLHQSEHYKAAELALHQEDAYFARLMGNEISRVSIPRQSPLPANSGNLVGTLSSALDSKATPSQMDSTANNLFRSASGGHEQPSPLLLLEKKKSKKLMNKNSSILDNKANTVSDAQSSSAAPTESVSSPSRQRTTRRSSATHSDAVNDLLRFQAKYGNAHDTPAGDEFSYSDEEDAEKSVEVFLDDTNEEDSMGPSMDNPRGASQRKEAPDNSPASATESEVSMGAFSTRRSLLKNPIGLEGRVDDRLLQKILSRDQEDVDNKSASSEEDTYFKPGEANVASAFRSSVNLPEDPLKQIATLGPAQGAPRDKKSKLESLFRPMILALSVDDAESRHSFDPYEIKVTESAPSLIESRDYRAIALHGSPASDTTKNVSSLAMFSPSMISIDSQFDANPSPARPVVSNQASYNADFLFSSKLGKTAAIQPKRNGQRDSSLFSISTIGARSRLSRPARSKAVTIPIKSSTSVISKDSSNISDDNSHVRFSGDAEPKLSLPRESTESEKSSFGNIVVPGIENKLSDLSDNMSDYGSRSSTGRSKVEFQSDPIPEEPDDGDIEIDDNSSEEEGAPHDSPEVLNRVQWSYRGKEGNLSAVTPHLKEGKPITNPTNSPFLRFKAAKSKFVKQFPKESPAKRASFPMAKRKLSGGSGVVSNRVQELNKRVSVARLLRKKDRRSTVGNPRIHDSMNKPLIRTPVIMNYKTDASGVGRFSLLGHQSEDDSSTASEENSDSQHGAEKERADDVSQLSSVHDFGKTRVSIPQSNTIEECEDEDEDENEDCDDQTNFTKDSATVATVRQEKSYGSAAEASSYLNGRESLCTVSTSSSGLNGVRKEVFGKERSVGVSFPSSRRSNASDGESTTMSSILNKENSNYLPFRSGANVVKPTEQRASKRHGTAPEALHLSTQRTPLQPSKWRSLAAAAKQKGSKQKGSKQKGSSNRSISSKMSGSTSRSRKGLSERNRNQIGPTYAC